MSINRDDIVFLRDTFIDAEGDYLDQLLKNASGEGNEGLNPSFLLLEEYMFNM